METKTPLTSFLKPIQGTRPSLDQFVTPIGTGFIKSVVQKTPGLAKVALTDFLKKEDERKATQTTGEQFVTQFVERPTKILNALSVTLPRMMLGGLSEAGKTAIEFGLTYGQAVLGKDLGEASLSAQKTIEGMSNKELEKKLFLMETESFAEYPEKIKKFLDERPEATETEKKVLPMFLPVLMLGAELFPGGGKPIKKGVQKLITELVTDTTPELALARLRGAGIPEEVAVRIAPKIPTANTDEAVKAIIKEESDRLAELMKAPQTPKTAPQQAVRGGDELSVQQVGMRDASLKIAKEQNIPITKDGNLILYHGTKEGRAPKVGEDWRIGSYFTSNESVARQFAGQGEGGRIKVMKVEVPPQAIFNSGDGTYFTLNEKVPVKMTADLTPDPLTLEARKHKSAEEFVRTKPTVYHGSPVPLKSFSNKKGGVFFTEEYADATGFAGTPDNVYEGFLNFKKPLEIDAKGAKWDALNTKYGKSTQEVISNAQKDGYDGVVFRNIIDNAMDDVEVGFPGTIYYAYKPKDSFINESQLTEIWERANKTTGLGDTAGRMTKVQDSSIQQAVDSALPKGSPLKAEITQELQSSQIVSSLSSSNQVDKIKSIAKEYAEWKKAQEGVRGMWIKIRETGQDSFIRARKLQEKLLGEKVTKVPDDINIDLAETLFHGRVHTRLQEVKDVVTGIDRNILKTSKALGVSDNVLKSEIDSFLHARHALERNAKLGDGAAGLTNVEAKKILAETANSPHLKEIERIAEEIMEVNRQTLRALLDAEVIDQALFDTLNKTYKHHVPLQRVMDETDDVVDILSGRGFDVKGTGIKRARGSDKQVADILTNVTSNVDAAIVRAEKNLVDLTTLRFAREHKSLGLFEEIKPQAIGMDFKGENIIFQQVTDPSVLVLREKGKPVYLKINDPALAVALKGVNVEKIPGLLRGIAFITRLYAGLHTRFNYEFALSNFVRDSQEMMVEMASRRGFREAGSAGKKQLFESKKAVADFLFGRDTPGAKLYAQMKADGGTTGGLSLSTREQVKIDIDNVRRLNRSNPKKAAVAIIEAIDKWNTLFEDATRFSTYKTALEGGASRKQAAFLAKESSVNFNKKGTAGPIINGLYMFSNASIQGTTKVLRAMKNPKVAGAVVASVGTTVYAVNEWNTSVDPDWRDKISKFDRTSNFTIMLPSDDGSIKYITLPVAWGLKPIKVSLEYGYDGLDGHGDWQDALEGIITSGLQSYNPLAGDESLLRTLTPTVLKTPIEISSNRAWYGNDIRPEYDQDAPDSTKYFRSLENTFLGEKAIQGTAILSESTNGAIEISPANVVYAFQQYIGGVGRSAEKIINTITSISKGEPVPAKERPILSRFFKETDEEQVLNNLFYNERERRDKEQAQQKARDVRRVAPIYEQAQALITGGEEEKAQAIVDALSDEDYNVYKTLKAADKRRDTTGLQIEMLPLVKSNQELILQGKEGEAQDIVGALSDEEYKAYEKVKEIIGEKSKPKEVQDTYGRSKLGIISDYAKAFTKDPANALKALLTKEKLGLVEGNLVELQRFYGISFTDQGGSQEYKRTLMASQGIPWSEAGNWKLEHITPVKAGGDNGDGNLMLVNNATHNFFTPIDIAVGNAVRQKVITRKEAEDLMLDFKIYKVITAEEVLEALQ